MLKNIKKRLKNQRGVTLVELLAVVVILGIIAAIAVPNIGGIIDKTKKDAHVANAQQMADAARLYVLGEKINIASPGTANVTLVDMINAGYIEEMKNPSGGSYDTTDDTVDGSYVVVSKSATGAYTFTVTLKQLKSEGAKLHYNGNPASNKSATL